jgi:hypothetical protein
MVSNRLHRHTPEPDGYTGLRYSPKHAQLSGDPLNSTPYKRDEVEKRYAYVSRALLCHPPMLIGIA